MKLTLSARSVIQEASGFREGYDTWVQFSGTRLFIKVVFIASSTADILIFPKTASLSCCNETVISLSKLL